MICVCILSHLSLGKRNLLAETAPRLLTVIRGFAILDLVREYEKGFRAVTFGGLFLLLVRSPLSIFRLPEGLVEAVQIPGEPFAKRLCSLVLELERETACPGIDSDYE